LKLLLIKRRGVGKEEKREERREEQKKGNLSLLTSMSFSRGM